MKLFLLCFLFYSISSFSDDFLNEKISKFQSAKTLQEKEALSSELFFVADNKLKIGDSGKALLYFKTALLMTPENNYLIAPKIEKSLRIFMDYTSQLPKENCIEIRERYNFLYKLSPDSTIKLINQFPKCLNEAVVRERINLKELQVLEQEQKIKAREDLLKKRTEEADLLEKEKLSFFRVSVPKSNSAYEKKVFSTMGEELDYVQRMNKLLPIEIIRSLQMEALKFVLFKADASSLVNSSINDETAVVKIPYKFDINLPETFSNELYGKYKNLLDYNGEVGIDTVTGKQLLVSNVVSTYFGRKQFNDEILLPYFPTLVVFRVTLMFQDKIEIALIPSILTYRGKNYKTLYFLTLTNEDRIRYMPDHYVNGKGGEFRMGLRLSKETIKNLKSINLELDFDATNEIDKAISRYVQQESPLTFKDISYSYEFHGSKGGAISGILIKNRKEGLFYITEKNHEPRKIYYESDREIQQQDIINNKEQEVPRSESSKVSPGFNCIKAATFSEIEICKNQTLSELDSKMNIVFKVQIKGDRAESIKKTQKLFIKEREKCLSSKCIEELYLKRINELSN